MDKPARKFPSTLKITILFMLLTAAFFTAWTIKLHTPINRPENAAGEAVAAWYERKTANQKSSEKDKWTLDPRIPVNYIPVPGEDGLYMVVDDSGKIIKYMRAEEQADGSLLWNEVVLEDTESLEPVEGLDSVYKYTDENGEDAFLKYIRNSDNTFAFVPVDMNGIPFTVGMDATTIGEFFQYTGEGNIYALLNENGVLIGYYNRFLNEQGQYVWQLVNAPSNKVSQVGNGQGLVFVDLGAESGFQYNGYPFIVDRDPADYLPPVNTQYNSDGTYTETTTVTNTEMVDGVIYTYETYTESIYLADGTLYRSKSDGPYLVSTEGQNTAVISGHAEQTLQAEYSRVSAYVSYDTNTANEILASLNARRTADGHQPLAMDPSSDFYKIACIRAADMAINDTVSTSSTTYGTISDLCGRYGLNIYPLENIWKTSGHGGEDIHLMFQANETSRSVRESDVSQCAIVVAVRNGMQYIVELYAY